MVSHKVLRVLHGVGLYKTKEELLQEKKRRLELERKKLFELRNKHEENMMFKKVRVEKRGLEERRKMLSEISMQEDEERLLKEEIARKLFDEQKQELEKLKKKKESILKRKQEGSDLFVNRLELFKERQRLLELRRKLKQEIGDKRFKKITKFKLDVRDFLQSLGLHLLEEEGDKEELLSKVEKLKKELNSIEKDLEMLNG